MSCLSTTILSGHYAGFSMVSLLLELKSQGVATAFSPGPIFSLHCGQLGHVGHPGPFLPGTPGVDGSVVHPAAPSGACCSGCPWWNWAGHCGSREHHTRCLHFGQGCPVALASSTHPWAPGYVIVSPSPGTIPLLASKTRKRPQVPLLPVLGQVRPGQGGGGLQCTAPC